MPTELLQRIAATDSLLAAWARTRAGGKAPGVDGVTIPQFARHVGDEIRTLRRELLSGAYRPWPARRVYIPKASGGMRSIGVQAVRDRVAQRALLALLQPRVEPTLEDSSFAYRPGRSVEDALARLVELRDAGYNWVARADISLCLDSLDRNVLMNRVAQVLPEGDAAELLRLWLSAGVVDDHGFVDPGVGVSQGDVLSPLLCNLYLDPFDEAVERSGSRLIRYADDFVLLGRSRAQVAAALGRAEAALGDLRLSINRSKVHLGTFIQGFEYLGAAVVGSLVLPLHRIERPGRPPRFVFGYGPPRGAVPPPSDMPLRPRRPLDAEPVELASSQRELRDHMVALLRAQRRGGYVPPMALALLRAWLESGILRQDPEPEPEPEGWQSSYLI